MNEINKTPEALEDTLEVIEDALQDAEEYSVYHKDSIQPEIDMIEHAIRSIRHKEFGNKI